MTKLKEFYATSEAYLADLRHTKNSLKDVADPFQTVVVGSPLVIEDAIALRLYEAILLTNTHFVPDRKPAIGMAVGDFIKNTAGDKDFITVAVGTIFTNVAFLHMGRNCEVKLVAWDGIEKEVHENYYKLLEMVKVNRPAFIKKFSLADSFHDACGLQYVNTPSQSFVENLKKMINELGRGRSAEEMINTATALIETCSPFTSVADEMYALRGVYGNKGHLVFHDTYFSMSNPSSSGDASWFQTTNDDLKAAIPGYNNLFFIAMHAGKVNSNIAAVGSGTTVEKSITFLVPPSVLTKLQKIVNDKVELKNQWEKFAYVSGEASEEVTKKASNWWDLTHRAFLVDERTKNIIREVVTQGVLGLQLDISDKDGKAVLRPVISKTYLDENLSILLQIDVSEPVMAPFEKLVSEFNDGYYGSKSIFDNKEAITVKA
jgi:hypothetical protein